MTTVAANVSSVMACAPCGRCGTSLTYRRDDDPDSIDIHTATVDAPDGFAPTREIWLEDKLAWMVSNAAFQPYPRSSRG